MASRSGLLILLATLAESAVASYLGNVQRVRRVNVNEKSVVSAGEIFQLLT